MKPFVLPFFSLFICSFTLFGQIFPKAYYGCPDTILTFDRDSVYESMTIYEYDYKCNLLEANIFYKNGAVYNIITIYRGINDRIDSTFSGNQQSGTWKYYQYASNGVLQQVLEYKSHLQQTKRLSQRIDYEYNAINKVTKEDSQYISADTVYNRNIYQYTYDHLGRDTLLTYTNQGSLGKKWKRAMSYVGETEDQLKWIVSDWNDTIEAYDPPTLYVDFNYLTEGDSMIVHTLYTERVGDAWRPHARFKDVYRLDSVQMSHVFEGWSNTNQRWIHQISWYYDFDFAGRYAKIDSWNCSKYSGTQHFRYVLSTSQENQMVSTPIETILFPNPARNRIYISPTESIGVERIVIQDAAGRSTTKQIEADGSIDISQLPIGLYYLSLDQNGHPVFHSFIKY